ncbi:helix-turn-helix domain-containing protein (plasmid) [Staphylococcus aureus]|nr:helix-turn-helix transcriptional regulator [Staphylococcus aureus]UXV49005.1 helix-turn-helix domain-containing protein [Staphylococcus aureus]
MKDLRNQQLRKEFKQWRKDNFNPSFRAIADALGINYNYLTDWHRGRFNIGENTLSKIEKLINKN